MARRAELIPADADVTDVFETIVGNQGESRTTQERRFDDIVADLNDSTDDSEIRVYRQSPMGGKSSMVLLESFPVDKYSMAELWAYVRDNYGAGDYRVHVRAGGKLVANKLLPIETPKSAAPTAITPGSDAAQLLNQVLAPMREMQQQMLDLMRAQNQAPDRMAMIQEMILMRQLFDNGGTTSDPFSQMSKMLDFMGKMGVTINGQKDTDDEGGFMQSLDKFIPVLTAAVSQPRQQAPNVRPTYRPNPTQQSKPKSDDPEMLFNMQLKQGLNIALTAAAKDADPAAYAQMLVDFAGSEKVRNYLQQSDAGEKLVQLQPKIAQYVDWFNELVEHAKALVGLPSTFSDLYDEADSVITPENDQNGQIDSANLSTDGNT